jgi:hypothetical protein
VADQPNDEQQKVQCIRDICSGVCRFTPVFRPAVSSGPHRRPRADDAATADGIGPSRVDPVGRKTTQVDPPARGKHRQESPRQETGEKAPADRGSFSSWEGPAQQSAYVNRSETKPLNRSRP